MTVAGKINALVISIAVIAGCLVTAHTLQREYTAARDQLLEQSAAQVSSQPLLQVAIYYRDRPALQEVLQGFIAASPAIRYAVIRDPTGLALKQQEQPDSPGYQITPFDRARGAVSVAEEGLTRHRGSSRTTGLRPAGTAGWR